MALINTSQDSGRVLNQHKEKEDSKLLRAEMSELHLWNYFGLTFAPFGRRTVRKMGAASSCGEDSLRD